MLFRTSLFCASAFALSLGSLERSFFCLFRKSHDFDSFCTFCAQIVKRNRKTGSLAGTARVGRETISKNVRQVSYSPPIYRSYEKRKAPKGNTPLGADLEIVSLTHFTQPCGKCKENLQKLVLPHLVLWKSREIPPGLAGCRMRANSVW